MTNPTGPDCKFTHRCTGCDATMQKPYSISNNQEMTLEQILKFIEERKQANDRHPACYCSGGQFIQKAEKTANQGTTAKTPGYLWAREKPGSGEPNAQPPMAPSATTVITSKRCVESRTAQKRPNTEMQFSIHYVGCPQRTTTPLDHHIFDNITSYGDNPSHNLSVEITLKNPRQQSFVIVCQRLAGLKIVKKLGLIHKGSHSRRC